jgi:hypothetical protein
MKKSWLSQQRSYPQKEARKRVARYTTLMGKWKKTPTPKEQQSRKKT